jgi:hypothetical protein
LAKLGLGIALGLVLGAVLSASANVGSFFVHVSDLSNVTSNVSDAYAAGVYDAVSRLGSVASSSGGIDTAKLVATAACLDNHGDKVSQFGSWARSTMQNATPSRSAADVIISVCIPK